jgi:hypothetical protein
MTRILFFLLLLLFVACTPQGVGDTVSEEMLCQAVTHPQNTICRVLEFYFCDARTDVKRRMTIGPFRLHGIAEEYTCSMLLPPLASSINSLTSFYTNGFIDASVAMYRGEIGFFTEYSPCWRLQVTAPSSANVEDVILEINYSYFYDEGGCSGFVKAMQRLPLRAMEVSVHGVGNSFQDRSVYSYRADENVPFSIVCLCFTLPDTKKLLKFYPL